MKNAVFLSLALAVAISPAYAVDLIANDQMGSSSFNSAGNWYNGLSPSAGNSYITLGYLLRTPAVAGDYWFGGDVLVVGGGDGGGANPFLTDGSVNSNALLNKTPGNPVITVLSLVLDAGYIRDGMGTEDVWTIEGYIWVNERGGGLANQCRFNINSMLTGTGPLYIADNGNPDPRRTIYINNPNNEYAGRIQLLGPSPDRCRLTFSAGSRMNFAPGYGGDCNRIVGTGTVLFDGDFYFNLSQASTTVGDSWLIADAAVQTFGPNFQVMDFFPWLDGRWWHAAYNGAFYVFDTQTGVLSVAESPIRILSPNGGEKYLSGKPLTITYSVAEQFPLAAVDFEFSTDTVNWHPIAYGQPITGTYEWFVPYIESDNYYIRTSSFDFWNLADTSDNPFTVFQCASPIPGDINEDCYVDLQDVAVLAQHWLLCGNGFDPACTVF